MRKATIVCRRLFSLLLAAAIVFGACAAALPGFVLRAAAASAKAANITCGDLTFVVPEVIYLTPATGNTSSSFQYYVNNDSDGSTKAEAAQGTGKIYYTYDGASSATISYQFYNDALSSTLSGGSVTLSDTNISSGSNVNITAGTSPTLNGGGVGCYIQWTLSFTDATDNVAKKAFAYTYVYKPYFQVAGGAPEAVHYYNNNNEAYSGQISWWQGIHSFDANSAPGRNTSVDPDTLDFRYPKTYGSGTNQSTSYYLQPLVKGVGSLTSDHQPDNWLHTADANANGYQKSVRYGYYETGWTRDTAGLDITAYASLITVDSSRYDNLNQIPNLKAGTIIVDKEDHKKNQCRAIGLSTYYYQGAYRSDGDYATYGSNYSTYMNLGVLYQTSSYSTGDTWINAIDRAVTNETFYFVTELKGSQQNYDAQSVVFCPLRVTPVDKSSLRTAVQNATKAMAKLGVNGATNGSLASCYFDANTSYKWTAFQTAYKNAVIALTKLGSTSTSEAATLNNALAALCTKVSFNANTHGTLSSTADVYVTIGTNQSVSYTPTYTATPNTGYTFSGWSTSPNATSGSDSVTVGYNNTLYAIWTPKNYTITYDANGGSAVSQATVAYGSALPSASSSRNGYTLTGWTYTGNGSTYTGTTMPAYNLSATANWSPIEYSISYNLDGGSATNPTSYYITSAAITLTNPTKTGYTFTGWSGTGLTGSANMTVTISSGSTGNRSYTAHWSKDSYSISYDLDGGSATNPTSYAVDTTTFTLANPTKTGYTFTGWSGTGLSGSNNKNVTIPAGSTGNRSYTAHWSKDSYSISYDLDGGSATNPTSYAVDTTTFTLANPTKTGYTFTGWSGTGLTGSANMTVTITVGSTGNRSYTAHWSKDSYSISYDLDGGSATNPTSYAVDTTTFTLANPTKTGYTFTGWSGTGLSGSANMTVTITVGSTGNRSYTAHWSINQYTITFDTDGGSAIAAITQNYGTAITAPANPTKTGYSFAGWTKNGAAASVPSTMPAESYTLKATWTINNHTITYVTGGGSAVAQDTVNYGAELPSRSSSLANAVFNGWVYTGNSATFTGTTMPDYDLTATAQWIFPVKDDTFILSSNRATNLNVLSNDEPDTALVSVGACAGFTTAVSNGKVVVTPSGAISSAVTFTYTASYNGSGSYTATVTLVPASDVYYEESGFITFESSTGAPAWQNAGTEYSGVFEEGLRPGATGSPMTAYQTTNETTYSLGNAKYVEVSAANKGGATATFTFSGTGFDFYSVTDNQSGLAFVDVYKIENGQETNVESTLINTYFGYKYGQLYLKNNAVTLDSSGTPIYNTSETGSGTFFIEGERRGTTTPTNAGYAYGWVAGSNEITGVYQVPVISWSSDTGYGTYKVVIEPRWSARQNMTGNSSYRFYVDAVRVYNPIDPSTMAEGTSAYDAYMADGEYGACYQSVRDLLINADSFGATGTAGNAGVAFLEPGVEVTVKNYKAVGPKNEVYLEPGQAIAFNLTTAAQTVPAKLSVGLRLAQGSTDGAVTVYSKDTTGVPLTVSGATELYRDITAAVTWQATGGSACTTSAPIIIANTSPSNSGAVISITNLKWSYNTEVTPASRMLSFSFAPQDLVTASAVMRQTQTVTPDTPAAPQTPQPDALSGRRMITLQALMEQIFGRIFETLRLAFFKK